MDSRSKACATGSHRTVVVLLAILGAALVVVLSGCSAKTTSASNVTQTSATLNGKLYWNDGDGPGEWWWEYSGNNGVTWTPTAHSSFPKLSCSSNPCSGPVSRDVTGLTPNTRYLFRIGACATENATCAGTKTYYDSTGVAGGTDYDYFNTVNYKVKVGTSPHDSSELVDVIPVGTGSVNAPRRVVMSLADHNAASSKINSQLPTLHAGDDLKLRTEVTFTHDCTFGTDPNCVGSPYRYAPAVHVRALLANSSDKTDEGAGAMWLGESVDDNCTYDYPDSGKHHCTLVIEQSKVLPDYIPCHPDVDCFVNIVAWANDANARSGDKVLVGDNNAHHGVEPGKGRDAVVRFSPPATMTDLGSSAKEYNTSDRVNTDVPLNNNLTVIYSQPIHDPGDGADGDLHAGEQLEALASITVRNDNNITLANGLGIIVANSRTDTTPNGGNVANPWLAELNGENCNARATCTRRKVGVTTVTDRPPGQLFINIVARSGTPFNNNNGNGQQLHILNGGILTVKRYHAGLG